MWWDDLSGAELRARLVQRGVEPDVAYLAVFLRDRSRDWRRFITTVLGTEPGR